MPKENYFEPKYVASRHKIVDELRELAKNTPKPQANWEVIWVLTGPEINFEGDVVPGEKPAPGYNQTVGRLETGLELAKQVTALRLNKEPEKVTAEDIKTAGPKIYYNGTKLHNDFGREMAAPGGVLEMEYNFPGENFIVTANEKITNTNGQFDDLPASMADKDKKIVLISDLYHLPRVKRYAKKNEDKFLENQLVFYPSQPQKLPVGKTIRDLRNIYPYVKKGFLPPED